ncbi:hypothetical protein CRE_14319 [Caenorhabditis remanei]|uniref:histone acetyltransferase n=1 Tax=Caenorhabditis remanei TaxID=31234 RepID=E3NEZ0_CAERE|nr:hypothetical protein CRE_14319 [Caenorhabditis remanei]
MQRSMEKREQEDNATGNGEQGTSRARNGPQNSQQEQPNRKRTYHTSEPSTSSALQAMNVRTTRNVSSTPPNFENLHLKIVSRIGELMEELSRTAENHAQAIEARSRFHQRRSDKDGAHVLEKLEKALKKAEVDLEKMKEVLKEVKAQTDAHELMRVLFDGIKGRRGEIFSKATKDCEAIFKAGGLCCGKFFDCVQIENCLTCGDQFHSVCREIGRRSRDRADRCECRIPQTVPTKFRSTDIPQDRCAKVIENRFKKWVKTDKKVSIRVLTADDMKAELGEKLEEFFAAMGKQLPLLKMRNRMILVFLEEDGEEILFFAMLANEYKERKAELITFRYLETVSYINDGELRRNVYDSIIFGYMAFAASIGYKKIHFWACPPDPDDSYLFRGRPAYQTVLDKKKLIEWYTRLLELGKTRGVISNYSQKYNGPKPDEVFELIEHLISDGGFWNKEIGKLFEEKYGCNETSHQQVQKDLRRLIGKKDHPIFYITLAPSEEVEAEEENDLPPISSKIAKTGDVWREFLDDHGLDFTYRETAINATLVILWALIRELCETGQMETPQTAPSVPRLESDSAPSTSSSR